jgi:hypothetical protein
MQINFAIIYRRLREFILHFAQQPRGLLQNCKYSQIDLDKLYNFDFETVFSQLPFLTTTLLAQKGNSSVFCLPSSILDHFG